MAAAWLAFLWSCGASLWSLLDLAKYMAGRRGKIHPVSTPRCPRGMAAHHYFPRLAMWAAQDGPPSRIAFRLELLVPVFPRSGVSPCRWLYDSWGGDQPAVVGGRVLLVCLWGNVFVLNRAAVPQSLHLMNDLAGTMQPELLPIGRTPLGKSRGFIHDLNLSFSRSTLLKTREADRLNVSADARPSTKYRCIGCC